MTAAIYIGGVAVGAYSLYLIWKLTKELTKPEEPVRYYRRITPPRRKRG